MPIGNGNGELPSVEAKCQRSSLFAVYDNYSNGTSSLNTTSIRWEEFFNSTASSKMNYLKANLGLGTSTYINSGSMNQLFDGNVKELNFRNSHEYLNFVALCFFFSFKCHHKMFVDENIGGEVQKYVNNSNGELSYNDFYCFLMKAFDETFHFGRCIVSFKPSFDRLNSLRKFYDGAIGAFNRNRIGNRKIRFFLERQFNPDHISYLFNETGKRKKKFRDLKIEIKRNNGKRKEVSLSKLINETQEYISNYSKEYPIEIAGEVNGEPISNSKHIRNLVHYVISINVMERIQNLIIKQILQDTKELLKRITIFLDGEIIDSSKEIKSAKFYGRGGGSFSAALFEGNDIIFQEYQFQYNVNSNAEKHQIKEKTLDGILQFLVENTKSLNFSDLTYQKSVDEDKDGNVDSHNITTRFFPIEHEMQTSGVCAYHFFQDAQKKGYLHIQDPDDPGSYSTFSIANKGTVQYTQIFDSSYEDTKLSALEYSGAQPGNIYNIPIGSKLLIDVSGSTDEIATFLLFHNLNSSLNYEDDLKASYLYPNNEFLIPDNKINNIFSAPEQETALDQLIADIKSSREVNIDYRGEGVGEAIGSEIVRNTNQEDNTTPDGAPGAENNDKLRKSVLSITNSSDYNCIYIKVRGFVSALRCTWVDYFTTASSDINDPLLLAKFIDVFGGLQNQHLDANSLVRPGQKGKTGEPNFNQPLSSFRAAGQLKAAFERIKKRAKVLNGGSPDLVLENKLDALLYVDETNDIPIYDYEGVLRGKVSFEDFDSLRIEPTP